MAFMVFTLLPSSRATSQSQRQPPTRPVDYETQAGAAAKLSRDVAGLQANERQHAHTKKLEVSGSRVNIRTGQAQCIRAKRLQVDKQVHGFKSSRSASSSLTVCAHRQRRQRCMQTPTGPCRCRIGVRHHQGLPKKNFGNNNLHDRHTRFRGHHR
eukprot:423985-Pleurochrysis_carterae.AAC.1